MSVEITHRKHGSATVLDVSGRLTAGASYALGRDTQKPMPGINRPGPVEQSFVGGIAIAPNGRYIFAVHVLGEALTMLDVKAGLVKATVNVGAEPYTCILSPDGKSVYVSVWGGAKVLAFDAVTLARRAEIPVGEHPNAMVFSKDGRRLFVACANTNSVWSLDLEKNAAIEQISVALFPNLPPGATFFQACGICQIIFFIFQHIVLIITVFEFMDVLSDLFEVHEIIYRSGYGDNSSRRNHIIQFGDTVGGNGKPVVQDIFFSSCQVKIGVIGQVKDGLLVGISKIIDHQFIVVVEGI